MAKKILLDSGFWYALFDERDKYHNQVQSALDGLTFHTWLLPWPTLYETLNTRFVRRATWMLSFQSLLNKTSVYRLDDISYREIALGNLFLAEQKREFSLVDLVIREMLKDERLEINALLTFNPGDFFDLCQKRRIELLII